MFLILLLISAVHLPVIVRGAESGIGAITTGPWTFVKTTFKSWYSMYNFYREEINLGYCWADYFLDIPNLVEALADARVDEINIDDPSPLLKALNGRSSPVSSLPDKKSDTGADVVDWKNVDGDKYSMESGENDDYDRGNGSESGSEGGGEGGPPHRKGDHYSRGTGNTASEWAAEDDNAGQFTGNQEPYNNPISIQAEKLTTDQNSPRYIYLGEHYTEEEEEDHRPSVNGSRALTTGRESASPGPSDLLISLLRGLNLPRGVGPLVFGGRINPTMLIMARLIGTFIKLGRRMMQTIESRSYLACTKDYLVSQFFRWINA